jgi:hypothetical protein
MLKVQFGNTIVSDSLQIESSIIDQKMYVDYTADSRKFHTLLVWSLSHILLLIVNIPGNQITKGDLLFEWETPIVGNNYNVTLYEQERPIRVQDLENRKNFPVERFAIMYKLLELDSVRFKFAAASRDAAAKDWFRAESNLSEGQRKYCRCTLKIAEKQTAECLRDRSKWGTGSCYNPYAVCAKSTRTSMGRESCMNHFDMDKIPVEFLRAYAIMNKIPLGNESHQAIKENITAWKAGGN